MTDIGVEIIICRQETLVNPCMGTIEEHRLPVFDTILLIGGDELLLSLHFDMKDSLSLHIFMNY